MCTLAISFVCCCSKKLSLPLLIKLFSLPFCCIEGLSDENHLVQNAALFALGQYSEYLQVR